MKEDDKVERIEDKIEELENYLFDLDEIVPESFERYKDKEKKAACERYFEIIITAVVDLAFLFTKKKDLKTPEDEDDVFSVLLNNDIINKELSKSLREAKGMRNIIVHQYGEINDELVFESIKDELGRDVKAFISSIRDNLR